MCMDDRLPEVPVCGGEIVTARGGSRETSVDRLLADPDSLGPEGNPAPIVFAVEGDVTGRQLDLPGVGGHQLRYPSHSLSHWTRGQALIGLGRFDEGLEPLHQALRIGPRDPLVGLWHLTIANCHLMRAEYSKAAESARTAWQANPRLPAPPLTLAAALHRDGKVDEARKIVADYRFRNPDFQTAQLERLLAGTEPRFVEGRQRLIDNLRQLGMQ